MFMYKQRENDLIVDRRNINTRAHAALLFTTQRPLKEKYEIKTLKIFLKTIMVLLDGMNYKQFIKMC